MIGISLDQSTVVVDEAFAEGTHLGLALLIIAVLDPGGHLMTLKRQDGAGISGL